MSTENQELKSQEAHNNEIDGGILDTTEFRKHHSILVKKPADELPFHSSNKVRTMMIEHYVRNEMQVKNTDQLVARVKNYLGEKSMKVHNVVFSEEFTGTEGRFMVLEIFTEGTLLYKHFKQSHLDEYLLEQSQAEMNSNNI